MHRFLERVNLRPGALAPSQSTTRLTVAAAALLLLSWEGLASGLVVVRPSLFSRLYSLMDASPIVAWLGLLLVVAPVAAALAWDYRMMREGPWHLHWQRGANRLLTVLSLAYLALDAWTLRGPWLVGQAGRGDRITVWTARLSAATLGVPLLAFALLLGFGVTLGCTGAALLRSYRAHVAALNTAGTRPLEVLIWLLCTLVCIARIAAIATFTAGGTV